MYNSTRSASNNLAQETSPANRAISKIPVHVLTGIMSMVPYNTAKALAHTCSTFLDIWKEHRFLFDGPRHNRAFFSTSSNEQYQLYFRHHESNHDHRVLVDDWEHMMRNGKLDRFNMVVRDGSPLGFLDRHDVLCFKVIGQINLNIDIIDQKILNVMEQHCKAYTIQMMDWPIFNDLKLTRKLKQLVISNEIRGFGVILNVITVCPRISVNISLQGLKMSYASLNSLPDKVVLIKRWVISFGGVHEDSEDVLTRLSEVINRIAMNNIVVKCEKFPALITVTETRP